MFIDTTKILTHTHMNKIDLRGIANCVPCLTTKYWNFLLNYQLFYIVTNWQMIQFQHIIIKNEPILKKCPSFVV